ncbi:hypothetical protein C7M84_018255 [Penaeus vannamei]|uniref:Uncharacterized protein n=1 Tax=Penaeus vannamei TaxID=6689 RepID=A0A423SHV2_PENVA|nr:hypothetical protein C7M84_018255 [Penaeus vannamei]
MVNFCFPFLLFFLYFLTFSRSYFFSFCSLSSSPLHRFFLSHLILFHSSSIPYSPFPFLQSLPRRFPPPLLSSLLSFYHLFPSLLHSSYSLSLIPTPHSLFTCFFSYPILYPPPLPFPPFRPSYSLRLFSYSPARLLQLLLLYSNFPYSNSLLLISFCSSFRLYSHQLLLLRIEEEDLILIFQSPFAFLNLSFSLSFLVRFLPHFPILSPHFFRGLSSSSFFNFVFPSSLLISSSSSFSSSSSSLSYCLSPFPLPPPSHLYPPHFPIVSPHQPSRPPSSPSSFPVLLSSFPILSFSSIFPPSFSLPSLPTLLSHPIISFFLPRFPISLAPSFLQPRFPVSLAPSFLLPNFRLLRPFLPPTSPFFLLPRFPVSLAPSFLQPRFPVSLAPSFLQPRFPVSLPLPSSNQDFPSPSPFLPPTKISRLLALPSSNQDFPSPSPPSPTKISVPISYKIFRLLAPSFLLPRFPVSLAPSFLQPRFPLFLQPRSSRLLAPSFLLQDFPLPPSFLHQDFPSPSPLPSSNQDFPSPSPLPSSNQDFPSPSPLPSSYQDFPSPSPFLPPTKISRLPRPFLLLPDPPRFPVSSPLFLQPRFPVSLALPSSNQFPFPRPFFLQTRFPSPSPSFLQPRFPSPSPLPSSNQDFPSPSPLPSSYQDFPSPSPLPSSNQDFPSPSPFLPPTKIPVSLPFLPPTKISHFPLPRPFFLQPRFPSPPSTFPSLHQISPSPSPLPLLQDSRLLAPSFLQPRFPFPRPFLPPTKIFPIPLLPSSNKISRSLAPSFLQPNFRLLAPSFPPTKISRLPRPFLPPTKISFLQPNFPFPRPSFLLQISSPRPFLLNQNFSSPSPLPSTLFCSLRKTSFLALIPPTSLAPLDP